MGSGAADGLGDADGLADALPLSPAGLLVLASVVDSLQAVAENTKASAATPAFA
ncbi:hypothetical protein BJ994_000131 [Arthrobacter pigmenti]|uniref:Uncharacterized protein n=1 Tax=Arthrobacter pigmenti TaxID=271432 RepID=A0A846RMK5_9MICC|nr:hypothetical protein [Arthrobacter pigmenti]NJC21055.1 hypothetical protein [Arthrobacter pigmenti]